MRLLITVSMPYWRCLSTVRRAVDAVLSQTHASLRLVVTCDGDTVTPPWPALDDIDDPRLVRWTLPANRGRYYCDAAVLAACDSPWWAIHDADDWADPRWLERMLAHAIHGYDAVFGPEVIHRVDGTSYTEPVGDLTRAHSQMRQLAHHAGLYRTAALRAAGGYHPELRIGYDTLIVGLMVMSGRVFAVDEPLYHRVARTGSLTSDPATGFRSELRRQTRARLERLYAQALMFGPAGVVAADIPADLAAEVDTDADRLREVLGAVRV